MRFQFQQLFLLRIKHSYYTDGYCSDFRITSTDATRALLARHQMIMRNSGARVEVMFRSVSEADLTHASIPLDEGDTMTFIMQLTRPELFNFTNELPGRGKTLLFSNSIVYDPDTENPLTATEVVVSGISIPYTVPKDKAVKAKLVNEENVTVYNESHPASSEGDRDFTIVLPAGSTGLYTLQLSGDISPDPEVYFVDAALQFERPFGLIRIKNKAPDAMTYSGSRYYSVVFTPTERRWSYYLVVTNAIDPDQLKVEDKSTIVEADKVKFEKITDLGSDKLPALLSTDTSKVRLYRTIDPLVYRQKPRPQFTLLKNNDSVLISDLPNADIGKPDTNMFIYV